ncbi:FAD binding domain-containing protein, partial [Streptomyces sp. NPDC050704]|uniref:FAD binding domain-containing protein n=1 Tax=Streptomyces sp. NPDC050704 TaxID=3157219 RepID=UPI00341E5672
MHPFSYTRVSDTAEALNAGRSGGRYIAGGTTLVDLMRETVERPETLVDITGL